MAKYFEGKIVEISVRSDRKDIIFESVYIHCKQKIKVYWQKMRTIFKLAILLFLISILFPTCREKEEYPPVPQLEFLSFTSFRNLDDIDSLGILLISYTDGDGDLGVVPWDTNSNFFVSYYVMDNGELKVGTRYDPTTGEIDTINFNARIPILAPDGYTGWIKGQIEDTIKPLSDPTSQKTIDTIMFEAWVIDRAGNLSNVVQTPLIEVKNQ